MESLTIVMVFLTFFGIRKDTLIIWTIVLSKFFLKDVAWEWFEDVMYHERRFASSKLSRIMFQNHVSKYYERLMLKLL